MAAVDVFLQNRYTDMSIPVYPTFPTYVKAFLVKGLLGSSFGCCVLYLDPTEKKQSFEGSHLEG